MAQSTLQLHACILRETLHLSKIIKHLLIFFRIGSCFSIRRRKLNKREKAHLIFTTALEIDPFGATTLGTTGSVTFSRSWRRQEERQE